MLALSIAAGRRHHLMQEGLTGSQGRFRPQRALFMMVCSSFFAKKKALKRRDRAPFERS